MFVKNLLYKVALHFACVRSVCANEDSFFVGFDYLCVRLSVEENSRDAGVFCAGTARKNCGFGKKLSDLTGKSNNFYGSRKKNLCFAFGLFGIILPTADIPLNNLLQPL